LVAYSHGNSLSFLQARIRVGGNDKKEAPDVRLIARALWLLMFLFAVGGCTIGASSYLGSAGMIAPELSHLSGSLNAEILGLHYIANLSWIRDGNDPPPGPNKVVYSMRHYDWSVTFEAPQSTAKTARAWFAKQGPELRRQFILMVDHIHRAYPEQGGRRFRIIALPPGSRIDESWPMIATSGEALPMTFALRLPGANADSETMNGVNLLLAHEFSHSYFWFHREYYRNNYSDEIVAYTTQHCLQERFFPPTFGQNNGQMATFWKEVWNMDAQGIYAKYHDKYPDTYLALFAAANELRRVGERAQRSGQSVAAAKKEYCRAMPTSGTDFTGGMRDS
jgi:hypothetical protein